MSLEVLFFNEDGISLLYDKRFDTIKEIYSCYSIPNGRAWLYWCGIRVCPIKGGGDYTREEIQRSLDNVIKYQKPTSFVYTCDRPHPQEPPEYLYGKRDLPVQPTNVSELKQTRKCELL